MQNITTNIEILFRAISILEKHDFLNNQEYFQKAQIEIDTPDGYSGVECLVKKKSKTVSILLETGEYIKCADKHLIFINENDCKFAEELKPNEQIISRNGFKKIKNVSFYEEETDVFDFQVNNKKHWYYDTAGFIHHNTMITAALSHSYSSIGHNTITIVPSTDLVNQTAETYIDLELDTGIFCGSKKDYKHKNVVATWQSLQNSPHILSHFKALIYDEMHGAKSAVSTKILNDHCKHIPFKFGVTGTFPKDKTEQLSLHCALGEILYCVSAKQLMDEGYITPVEIEAIRIKQKDKPEKFPDYGSERTFLSKNEERIDFISDLIAVKAQEFGNVLVLVNSVSFGEKLAANIDGAVFLYGGIKNDERKEQYDQYKTRNDIITVATFGIASTGISINEIFCLIMVDAGKSFIRTIQTVGRSLRLSPGKDKAHVVDIYGNLFWSKKHYKERKKWYTEAEYPIVADYEIKI